MLKATDRFNAHVWTTVALSLAVSSPTAAQPASVQGLVTSAATAGPVEGMQVMIERAGETVYGTLTDRNGFYQIGGIAPGSYMLRGRHIGFTEHTQEISLSPGDRLTISFRVEPQAVEIEGVVVSPITGAAITDFGRQRITPAQMRLVPVPAGTGDLASYLQTLPGVVTTGDRGGQLFVRGGLPAENLVLVDGIPIYQPFHILGFFSVFPEDLVSNADFYAGGFGPRYYGRSSSVLDVHLRDGDPHALRGVGSVSPFIVEALVEGPMAQGVSWLASARRSLIEETSGTLLGSREPQTFDSQLFKLSLDEVDDLRCSGLALRTFDRGSLDPESDESYVSWHNQLVGGRCISLFPYLIRMAEINFSFSTVVNAAVSRGSSRLHSKTSRMHHEVNTTMMVRALPVFAGYHLYTETTEFDLTELMGIQQRGDQYLGIGGYAEIPIVFGDDIELRPGAVLTWLPKTSVEPRLRVSWQPFGRPTERLQGAAGLYRQYLVGTGDLRDVSSVFTAWMPAPDDRPLEAIHGAIGWQQQLGSGFNYLIEGFYKRMRNIPVPLWRAVAVFTTTLARADGEVHGIDARIEYGNQHFYGIVGYGYSQTEYGSTHPGISADFGDEVQRYHPPHDRRHQVNALASFDVAGFQASARWQFGSGLPYTSPQGFDEAFDYAAELYNPSVSRGATRMVLDRPFNARLPLVHRLDVSVERGFDFTRGRLTLQAGAINAYDRRNMFYYDIFSGRRLDQLPLVPYVAVTMRGR